MTAIRDVLKREIKALAFDQYGARSSTCRRASPRR